MNEQIINGFNCLRNEQRILSIKVSELESDLTEHRLVIDALKEVDPNRKSFRMIGGVLVERTVGQVLPSLVNNKIAIEKLIETMKGQIQTKGEEIGKYVEKHNIKIRVPIETDSKQN